MEKTIRIGKIPVRLNNNVGWAMEYRDQFGRDIIPTIMPMAAGAIDIVSGLINETGKTSDVSLEDIIALSDGDTLIDAIIHLGGLEFVDFINITWALAKCADETIPEPREWIRQFDDFPVDVIGPVVVELIYKGVVSSKNRKRLESMKEAIRPKKSDSTTSSSQDSSEA